jgi:small redox-active disulfide protein 2
MKVQVLGTGCPKCAKVAGIAAKAIEELGADAEVVKVTDINDIMDFGVMMTPALAIDGEVKVSGKVPSLEDVKKWIGG